MNLGVRDTLVALVAVSLGAIGGVLWSRWRHQVVSELRAIRRMLETEQEPTLKAIRAILERDTAEDESGA